MRQISYCDVIELGFKREDCADSVFFKHYGYNYFIVSLKINNHISLYWDCNDRTVDMYRIDKEQNIVGTIKILSLNHLVEILLFFGKINNKKHNGIIAK